MIAQIEYLPEVASFLSQKPIKLFIGGKWVDASEGGAFDVIDPGTGSTLATVSEGKASDIEKAVTSARQAFQNTGWPNMTPQERSVILHKLADLVDKHLEPLAQLESLDVGKPLSQSTAGDIPTTSLTLRWFADLAVHTRLREPIGVSGFESWQVRYPRGVAAFILPWNFPFLLLGWSFGPALAAGNAVVLKPAENTPLSSLYFCQLCEEAGIPPGIVNVVPGYGEEAGLALARNAQINHMGFTGSPEVGKLVAESCGQNLVPTKLELGGKGAAVIFDDVDIDNVADQLVSAVTLNAGQVCCTATRWLVHKSKHDKLIESAIAKMEAVKIGHGIANETEMGPVVSEVQRKRVLSYLDKGKAEGATTLLEGGVASVADSPNGYYVKPGLLGGDPQNVCAREEIFGPVAYVMPFKDEEEAVNLVNMSNYGLANSVWSSNLDRAKSVAERLVAANSWINGHNLFPIGVPYGGCNLSGMGGGVNSPETLLDYLRPQSFVRVLDDE
jgi:aldehyde dehydrogenase (NAD+)